MKNKIDNNHKQVIKEVLILLQLIIAVAGIILIVAPSSGYMQASKGFLVFNSYETSIGYSFSEELLGNTVYYEIFNFSFLNFLPYILYGLIVVAIILKIYIKKYRNIINICIALMFVVSGILLFNCTNFINYSNDFSNITKVFGIMSKSEISLAWGNISNAILAFIGFGFVTSEVIISK